MKPSIIFDRWIAANAAAIEAESKEFQKHVAFSSLYLKMLKNNRGGHSPGMAKAIGDNFARLSAQIAARGLPRPKFELPKIKVVHPGRPKPRR